MDLLLLASIQDLNILHAIKVINRSHDEPLTKRGENSLHLTQRVGISTAIKGGGQEKGNKFIHVTRLQPSLVPRSLALELDTIFFIDCYEETIVTGSGHLVSQASAYFSRKLLQEVWLRRYRGI